MMARTLMFQRVSSLLMLCTGGTNNYNTGPELRKGEKNDTVSWPIIFLQNTMMKGMIETRDNKMLLHATKPESDWKLPMQYFSNFIVFTITFKY